MACRQLRGALDFDVGLHPHVYARLLFDRRRDELVARGADYFSGKPHRPDSDGVERARRDTLWNSLPGLLPGLIWNRRGKHSGVAARAGRVRLVWDPNLDWRRCD